MSTKTNKRKQKRLNTSEEEEVTEKTDKKSSPKKNEDDSVKDTIIIDDDEKEQEEEKVENCGEKSIEEVADGEKVEDDRERADVNGQGEETNETDDQKECKGFEVKETEHNGEVDDKNEEETEEIKNGQLETDKNTSCTDSQNTEEDLEPLVIESENESQLQSDSTESQSDIDKSPVISNRVTRSHTKNSPQSKVENGMDTKITNDVRVNVMRLSGTTDSKDDSEYSETDDRQEDVTNASIFVNLGNDTTKNFDITTTEDPEETISSSFIETHKDVTYGETLRGLTGRRTLRSQEFQYRPRHKPDQKDSTDSRKSYIPHISSMKRKGTLETLDDSKRFKTEEDSPGLMSYISSPINTFRGKNARSEIPSSTPKLMSYKYTHHQGNNIIDDMSKIELEEKTESKKWCSIM